MKAGPSHRSHLNVAFPPGPPWPASDEEKLSEVLIEFAKTMVTDFPIQSILDHLVKRIVAILPIGSAGVTVISPGTAPAHIAASDESALRYESLQSELAQGPCLLAFRSGEAVLVPDLSQETRFPEFTRRALAVGLEAVFTLPLRHDAEQMGALDLYRDTPGPLSPDVVVMAQTLADVAAAYLRNAQSRVELQTSINRSRHITLHDPLTGLPTRILVLERLAHAFLRNRQSALPSAVLFIAVDHFRTVNDTYGYGLGDALLVAVAQRLSELLRPQDTLGRVSGDEFVVVCEDLNAPAEAAALGARIVTALGRPFPVFSMAIDITASVGTAFASADDSTPENLLHDADLAMCDAKDQGRGRQVVYESRHHPVGGEVRMEHELRRAIERSELHLEYQPIVTTVGGRTIGFEALLRWVHPTYGLVPPSTLIPVAEHSGLINSIGHWVLAQAWSEQLRWPADRRGKRLGVSVNVSANQLMATDYAATVARVLASSRDSDPNLLTLEVTEGVFLRDGERALAVLNDLKKLGVQLALDDFGTGYSSLGYLNRFPMDVIKIDRAFLAGIDRDPASLIIFDAVVRLAHDLNMTTVAEGVETAPQHQQVADLHCDSCQGYYFARPMSAADVSVLIRHVENGSIPVLPSQRWGGPVALEEA